MNVSTNANKRTKNKQSKRGHATLLSAFVAAQHDGSQVQKHGRNEEGNGGRGYAYALAEDIITEAKAILRKHDLAVLPTSTHLRERPSSVGIGGLELVSTFVLVHSSSGQERSLGERTWPVVLGPEQPLDRAYASADTSLLAYFLRNLLQMPRVEEGGDADDSHRDVLLRQGVHVTPPSCGTGARRPSGSTRAVDNITKLTRVVDAEMERLNVDDEERERKARRVLGREPQTMIDLKELIMKLRKLGRDR